MNALAQETSPYLLQHAHNPVDWYPWKPEVFVRAKRENKPILVSIGYSTCHWCHVMERESFEDEHVAAFMNDHFINIKVDREERPDVDQIYMEACQLMTGHGGWPLNCFLLPDGRPFYAGTYFPPRPVHNRPSWMQVLHQLAQYWADKRLIVINQAAKLTEMIAGSDDNLLSDTLVRTTDQTDFQSGMMDDIFAGFVRSFDREAGGFGSAPKFPQSMSLRFLLEYAFHRHNDPALQHLLDSLRNMIYGGIYDQLGGGFARYATDRTWRVPHFEKMLYDNALLVGLAADTLRYLQQNDLHPDHQELLRMTIRETLDWVDREMTAPTGGFYSALDADSEGQEGKFYVWTLDELRALDLPGTDAFAKFYNLSSAGNWEGVNILYRTQSLSAFAVQQDESVETLRAQFNAIRSALLSRRERRVRPGLDDKILLDWNALMITAYAKAAAALESAEYAERAATQLDAILRLFQTESEDPKLKRTHRQGLTQYDAFLNDYAYVIQACLQVYELQFDPKYLHHARTYTNWVIDHFSDADGVMFYFTKLEHGLIVRRKDLFDSALPSGVSTMIHNLHHLAVIFGEPTYHERAKHILQRIWESVEKYPTSFARYASAGWLFARPPVEIAVVGRQATDLARTLLRYYLPGVVLLAHEGPSSEFPLLADKPPNEKTLIYVCQNYSCQNPVSTVTEAAQLLQLR